MSRLLYITIFIALVSLNPASGADYEWYHMNYERISDPELDSCLYAETDGLRFTIDHAEISFSQSTELFVLPPIDGTQWGLLFRGNGRIVIEPPTSVERFALEQHLGESIFERRFERARLYASPELISHITDGLDLEVRQLPGRLTKFFRNAKDRTDDEKVNIEAAIVAEIAGDHGEVAWFDFMSADGRYAVLHAGTATESFRLLKTSGSRVGDFFETVISCFPKRYYDSGGSWKHRPRQRVIEPLSYTIDAELTGREHIRCRTRVRLLPLVDSIYSLVSMIYYKTDIDSVFGTAGDSLYVSKMDEEPALTVFFNSPLMRGDTTELTYYYTSEDLIQKDFGGNYYISTQTNWYPSYSLHQPAQFDLRFRCPKKLTLASIGMQAADSISGDYRYTRWVTPQPEKYAAFNYGYFDTLTVREENVQTVIVYRGESHRGDLFSKDMRRVVASDIIGSLRFFNFKFGDIPYDPILVTEIPFSHGQGSPGLLSLSRSSFKRNVPLWTSLFRAHEVAHQWWGHIVQYDNYHDQWISEGFAEFSGAWFVETRYDYDRYLEVVENWRKRIVQKGGGHGWDYSMGTEAGPIWLGRRLSSSQSDDYYDIMYCKGAYVLHMLRCMMRDWARDSDEDFSEMMRDFITTYYREPASTLDFQNIVERHVGKPMDWFFDQWVFGIDVPELDYDANIHERDGKFLVDLTIEQSRVSDSFISIVPIRLVFDDELSIVMSVQAKGHLTETTLPPLDFKPKDIEFNYFKGALER